MGWLSVELRVASAEGSLKDFALLLSLWAGSWSLKDLWPFLPERVGTERPLKGFVPISPCSKLACWPVTEGSLKDFVAAVPNGLSPRRGDAEWSLKDIASSCGTERSLKDFVPGGERASGWNPSLLADPP